jgi:hypothetical protein
MDPWRVCRTVVADSHHFDEEEEQDPYPGPLYSEELDPDPHSREKLDPDPEPHQVMRISNPGSFVFMKQYIAPTMMAKKEKGKGQNAHKARVNRLHYT